MNNERTVKSLIYEKIFHIPVYQRSYVWTEKNWAEMWKDIIDVTSASGKYRKHFIGSIIYIEEQVSPKEQESDTSHDTDECNESVTSCLVIDGQQRLTTFTLLVAAVCYYLAKKTDNEKAKEYLRDLKNNYLFKGEAGYKFPVLKLRPADANKQFFKDVLDPLRLENQPLPDKFNKKDSQIIAAFCFFQNKIESYLNPSSHSIAEDERIIKAMNLINTAFERLYLIPMQLGEGDEPQRIFECMNHRGLSLEQSDLIRNYVLQGWDEKTRAQLHSDYWEKIEKIVKDKNAKKKVDEDKVPDFFRHYIAMRENRFVKEDELFETFKTSKRFECSDNNGKRLPNKMEEVLTSVLRFAGYYRRILNSVNSQPDDCFDKTILRHLWYVNQLPQASTTYPFLMRILDDYALQIIDRITLTTGLELVQSYIVRSTFCGRDRRGFNKIFAALYKKSFEKAKQWDTGKDKGTGGLSKGISAEEYVERLQRGLGARSEEEKIPDNDQWKKSYQEFNLYHNRTFCKYVLLRLEEKLQTKKSDTLPNENDLTIEHVFPQRPSPEWREIDPDGLTQSLGNLTLTTRNAEMGNQTFAEKRKIGFEPSGLKLNKYLADLDSRIKWNGEKIRERGEHLFKLALKIWQDIPDACRDKQESKGWAIKDLDVGEFFDDKGKNDTPLKIKRVVFGKYEIDGKAYAGKKPKGSWQNTEDELSPAYEMPEGKFYHQIMLLMYQEHESTFETLSQDSDVGLEYTAEEEDKVRFVVPHSIIEKDQWFARQTDYRKMWENIKRAAEETETSEMLHVVFAE